MWERLSGKSVEASLPAAAEIQAAVQTRTQAEGGRRVDIHFHNR